MERNANIKRETFGGAINKFNRHLILEVESFWTSHPSKPSNWLPLSSKVTVFENLTKTTTRHIVSGTLGLWRMGDIAGKISVVVPVPFRNPRHRLKMTQ